MKKLLPLGLWMTFAVTGLLGADKPPAAPSFEQIIFDKADFIKRLPENTLIWPDPTTHPKSPRTFVVVEGALKELGDVPGVKFFRAPPEVTLPIISRFSLPPYPEKMLKTKKPGEVRFLILINSTGSVSALYCFQATSNEFAIAAAQCVVDWKFQPALYGKTKVSILTVMPVVFPWVD